MAQVVASGGRYPLLDASPLASHEAEPVGHTDAPAAPHALDMLAAVRRSETGHPLTRPTPRQPVFQRSRPDYADSVDDRAIGWSAAPPRCVRQHTLLDPSSRRIQPEDRIFRSVDRGLYVIRNLVDQF